MFSGIVQAKGKVISDISSLGIKKITVEAPKDWLFKDGESVAIDGICSTVISSSNNQFTVQYMPETLKKTTANNFYSESVLNLEKSLKMGESIDGHFVYGHIDALSIVTKIKKDGESKVISFSLGKDIEKYLAYKGSVTINGVSLTISNISKKDFEVSLIPYTLENTNLGNLKTGDAVNIETDILARYVERIINHK